MTDATPTIWLNFDSHPTAAVGDQMMQMASELYPLHRSLTGSGVRDTLRIISRSVPIELRSVPSGQQVLDWQIPDEWKIGDAWVKNSSGKKLIDLAESTLHVVGYSTGIDQMVTCHQLAGHVHTLPEHPDWIPYRTSYYRPDWGFCARHRDWQAMVRQSPDQPLHVRIDAQHQPGRLDYGELVLPGESKDEFLISTHICHPSLANDNLSGIVVAAQLARLLAEQPNRPMTFRFLFIPATIGAITWLSLNSSLLKHILAGLVLSNLGDAGPLTYKRSRRQNALIDQVAADTLARLAPGSQLRDFTPWGYDERQYCSPGFNLPVGRLTRTPEAEYPQYHTSADDLSLISAESLAQSLSMIARIITQFTAQAGGEPHSKVTAIQPCWSPPSSGECWDRECKQTNTHHSQVFDSTGRLRRCYLNLRPCGEPKLDRYGLYRSAGQTLKPELSRAILWMLSLSDGQTSLDDIATRSGCDPRLLSAATERLLQCKLLKELP